MHFSGSPSFRRLRAIDSTTRTKRCSACCASPCRGRCRVVLCFRSFSFLNVLGNFELLLSPEHALHCPPRHGLTDPLCEEEPVIRQFVRCLRFRLNDEAVIEIVAIQLHGMSGIGLGRLDLGLLLVAESDPAALTVPVLPDFFPV